MSYLLGMSFDMAASPAMRLKALPRAVYHHLQPFGWGIAWYPSGDQAAVVIKDPTTLENSAMTQLLKDWKRFRSSIFLAHIRGAAKRRTQQDTHPFSQSYARRTWLMAHNGDLAQDLRERLPIGEEPEFEPIGRTDSEHAFCWLMGHVSRSGARTLDEVGWDTLHGWLRQINALGTANLLLTDGVNLVGYHDQDGFGRLHWARMTPPHTHQHFENEALSLALDDPMDQNLTLSIFSAQPMSNSEWTQLQPGQMVVLRRGALRWSSLPEPPQRTTPPPEDNDALRTPAADPAHTPPIHLSGRPTPAGIVPTIGALQRPPAHPIEVATPQPAEGRSERSNRHQVEPPQPLRPRILRITHETIYRYREPVEESTHLLRLRPVHDFQQQLVDYALHIDPMGIQSDFEDVFGNWISRLDVEIDYDVMSVRSHSLVKLQVNTRLTHSFSNYHDSIPLVWMPWHRDMMHPYLLPPELPVSQLRELSDYAMSFVERQDHDLIETLLDINTTIYNDYAYVPGSTNLETTPYEVYVNRRGVCQDFANLFICLARMLNIPARYRVGYIYTGSTYTGSTYDNTIQSEASHAWAELYLPLTGWRGFDPTNGCLAGQDHIRVACGRNYRDATPTSGTIYRGGSSESLTVDVRVEEIDDDGNPISPPNASSNTTT